MKTIVAFTAGVVSATVTGFLAVQVWFHLVEHNAYTKGAR
jgi:hypothetical protein